MSWASVLKPIAEALFSTIVDAIKSWYEQEKREAAEWAAKSRERQIESFKEGRVLEAGMREARETAVAASSVAEWNRQAAERNRKNRALAVAGLLFCTFALSGCFRFYVSAREYKPYIQVPTQPTLSEDAPMDNADFRAVLQYSTELQSVVDFYNEQARRSNIQNGFEEEAASPAEPAASTPTP